MKQHLLKISAIAFAVATVALGSGTAAFADDRVVATVPFPFIVGDVQLPSGVYMVGEMYDNPEVMEIKGQDGHQCVYTLTIPASTDTSAMKAELVFEKFGNHYFLSRIVPQGGGEREVILTPSTMERDIVKTPTHSSN